MASEECLNESDLAELIEILYPLRDKYKLIGIQMGLSLGLIKSIQASEVDNVDRLLEILSRRIHMVEPLQWADIAKVLESQSVNEHMIADVIRQKYCHTFHGTKMPIVEYHSIIGTTQRMFDNSDEESSTSSIEVKFESEQSFEGDEAKAVTKRIKTESPYYKAEREFLTTRPGGYKRRREIQKIMDSEEELSTDDYSTSSGESKVNSTTSDEEKSTITYGGEKVMIKRRSFNPARALATVSKQVSKRSAYKRKEKGMTKQKQRRTHRLPHTRKHDMQLHKKRRVSDATIKLSPASTASDVSFSDDELIINLSGVQARSLKKLFQSYFGRLCVAFKDPIEIASQLQAKHLLTLSTLKALINSPEPQQAKTITLVAALNSRVKLQPDRIFRIINVLLNSIDLRELGTEMMMDTAKICPNYAMQRVAEYHEWLNTKKLPPSTRKHIKYSSLQGVSLAIEPSINPVLVMYQKYLQSVYRSRILAPADKYLPTLHTPYIKLAMIRSGTKNMQQIQEYYIQGMVDQILKCAHEINIEDLLVPERITEGEIKFVLAEGLPGIGKSVFAWEICRRWDELKSLRRYLVILLLRLYESWVLNASSLSELFRFPPNPELSRDIAQILSDSNGGNLLLILDGFDEVSYSLHDDSVIKSILCRQLLPECTIILTTRPSAKATLESMCLPRVDKHVEIIGFTEEEKVSYINEAFSTEPELRANFMKYMFLVPHIKSMMYIPLYCAVIAQVYYESQSSHYLAMPKTRTLIYRALIHSILVGHMKRKGGDEYTTLLPEGLNEEKMKSFKVLAKFAFDTYHKEATSKKLTFFCEDIPEGLVHFGLMNEASEMFAGKRLKRTFSFIHESLQEYLAAWHLAHSFSTEFQVAYQHLALQASQPFKRNLSIESSIKQEERAFIEVIRPLGIMLAEPAAFLAGITGWRCQSDDDRNPWETCLSHDTAYISNPTFLWRCLYEAQNPSVIAHYFVPESRKNITLDSVLVHSSLIPYDCYALSYCLANYSDQLNLSIGINNYSDMSQIETFVCGFDDQLKHNLPAVTSLKVTLRSSSVELNKRCLLLLSIFMHSVKVMHFEYYNPSEFPANTLYDLCSPTDSVVTSVLKCVLRPYIIAEIRLSNISRESVVSVHQLLLHSTPSLVSLELVESTLGYDGIVYICSALKYNCTLEYLLIHDFIQRENILPNITKPTEFLLKLNRILKFNTSLKKFDIQTGLFSNDKIGCSPLEFLQQLNLGALLVGRSPSLKRSYSFSDIVSPHCFFDSNSTSADKKKTISYESPDTPVMAYFSGLNPCLKECLHLTDIQSHKNEPMTKCILRPDLSPELIEKYRVTSEEYPAPLTIHYPGMLPITITPLLVEFLLNYAKWELTKPLCIHKNCVQFSIRGNSGTVSIISVSKKFLEVHVKSKLNIINPEFCPNIKEDILSGLKVSNNSNLLKPNIGFLCSGVCNYKQFHVALLDSEMGAWSCSEDKLNGRYLKESEIVWFNLEEIQFPLIRGASNDIVSRTKVIVPHYKSFKYEWKEQGISINIPKGAISNKGPVVLCIQASVASGNYKFSHRKLVSCVYWMSLRPYIKSFCKKVALSIQHCASHNDEMLSFVTAKCTQKELPYSFELLQGGLFAKNSRYGTIFIRNFSSYAVVGDEPSYALCTYCDRKSVNLYETHITVTKNLKHFLEDVSNRYATFAAGPSVEAYLVKDEITFKTDFEGKEKQSGWNLTLLKLSTLKKKLIDDFSPGKLIPHFGLQLEDLRRNQNSSIKYIFDGVVPENLFLTLPSSFLNQVTSSHNITSGETDEEWNEDCNKETGVISFLSEDDTCEVYEALYSVASRWKNIGLILRLDPSALKKIGRENKGSDDDCLLEFIALWLTENYNTDRHGKPTWTQLAKAVANPAGGSNNSLASKLKQKDKTQENSAKVGK